MSGKPTSQNAGEIKFQATVARVQTMADGGIRLVLDMSEDNVMQAAQLMECKRFGVVLDVVVKPDSR
jgi:hypothetical protein